MTIPVPAMNEAMDLLPEKMRGERALVMLAAIGLQESRFTARRQLVGNPPQPIGPAKSYWQAEQGGGMIHGVRVHAATRGIAADVYALRGVAANDRAIWDAVEHDDVLACALARLLLWTDPAPLPAVGSSEAAWALYMRTWRPGKPHHATWPKLYAQAMGAFS